jgi:hypothetical protein
MRPGALYRRTVDPGRFWYTRPPKGTAKSIVYRLSSCRNIRTKSFQALSAARSELAGEGVLAVRHLRGVDPATGRRFELEDYVCLPLDYRLREIKRRPGYEARRLSEANRAQLRASEERRLSEDAEDATWD